MSSHACIASLSKSLSWILTIFFLSRKFFLAVWQHVYIVTNGFLQLRISTLLELVSANREQVIADAENACSTRQTDGDLMQSAIWVAAPGFGIPREISAIGSRSWCHRRCGNNNTRRKLRSGPRQIRTRWLGVRRSSQPLVLNGNATFKWFVSPLSL